MNEYLDSAREKAYMLRGLQVLLSEDERLYVWGIIQSGYCKHCGEKLNNRPCPCLKDE